MKERKNRACLLSLILAGLLLAGCGSAGTPRGSGSETPEAPASAEAAAGAQSAGGAASEEPEELKLEALPDGVGDLSGLDLPCWDGVSVAEAYSGGSGTPGDPYQIGSGAELALMAQQNSKGSNQNAAFCLTADILLNDVSDYRTLAASETTAAGNVFPGVDSFRGIFDGRGHTIYGLIAQKGLFSETVGAEIRDLHLEAALIGDYAKPYHGYAGGIVGIARGSLSITGCSFTGRVRVPEGGECGGILGAADCKNDVLMISQCTNHGTIGVESSSTVGGIAGNVQISQMAAAETSGAINGCTNTGEVCGGLAGGILGEGMTTGMYTNTRFAVYGCDNYGEIRMRENAMAAAGIIASLDIGADDLGDVSGCRNFRKLEHGEGIIGMCGMGSGSVINISNCDCVFNSVFYNASPNFGTIRDTNSKIRSEKNMREMYGSLLPGVRAAAETGAYLLADGIYYRGKDGALWRAEPDGSRERMFATLNNGPVSPGITPKFSYLSDGSALYYYDGPLGGDQGIIRCLNFASGEITAVAAGTNQQLLGIDDGTLFFTSDFHTYRWQPGAEPEQILEKEATGMGDAYLVAEEYSGEEIENGYRMTYRFYDLNGKPISSLDADVYYSAAEGVDVFGFTGRAFYRFHNGVIERFDPTAEKFSKVCAYSGPAFQSFYDEDAASLYLVREMTEEEYQEADYQYNAELYRVDRKTGEAVHAKYLFFS